MCPQRTANKIHPGAHDKISHRKEKSEEKYGHDHNDGRSGHFFPAWPGYIAKLFSGILEELDDVPEPVPQFFKKFFHRFTPHFSAAVAVGTTGTTI
jgi:hypothetical protein